MYMFNESPLQPPIESADFVDDYRAALLPYQLVCMSLGGIGPIYCLLS